MVCFLFFMFFLRRSFLGEILPTGGVMMFRTFVSFLFSLTFLSAEVIEIKSIREILPHADEETVVIFDVDDTLLESKLQWGRTEWYRRHVNQFISSGMKTQEAHLHFYPTWIEVQKVCPIQTVERATRPVIEELQQRGVRVMAMTHRHVSIKDVTFGQFQKLGIDFTINCVHEGTLEIEAEHPTIYQDGALFVCDLNGKGEIFQKFLKTTGLKAKKILFINDNQFNVQDVEKALSVWEGEYIGFFYNRADRKNFDAVIAETQFQLLLPKPVEKVIDKVKDCEKEEKPVFF